VEVCAFLAFLLYLPLYGVDDVFEHLAVLLLWYPWHGVSGSDGCRYLLQVVDEFTILVFFLDVLNLFRYLLFIYLIRLGFLNILFVRTLLGLFRV
jgi:hypothetical protein